MSLFPQSTNGMFLNFVIFANLQTIHLCKVFICILTDIKDTFKWKNDFLYCDLSESDQSVWVWVFFVALLVFKTPCLEIPCRYLCNMNYSISLQFVFCFGWRWVALQHLFLCSQTWPIFIMASRFWIVEVSPIL